MIFGQDSSLTGPVRVKRAVLDIAIALACISAGRDSVAVDIVGVAVLLCFGRLPHSHMFDWRICHAVSSAVKSLAREAK